MRYQQTTVPTRDGHPLWVRYYQQTNRDTSRTLVLVHGACEHGEFYDPVARLAAARGWNVILADQRGHGRSDGEPTHVDNFMQYVDDLDHLFRHFDCRPDRTFLVGHSMGGLVSVRYAQTFPDRVAGLVLISPLLQMGVPVSRLLIALGWVLSVFAPRTRFQTKINYANSIRCPKEIERRKNDPLVHDSITAGWFFAVRESLAHAWHQAADLRHPVLLVQAGLDRLVDPIGSKLWLQRLKSRDKTFHLLPESLHNLLGEPNWQETMALVADWLDERVAGVGSSDPRRSDSVSSKRTRWTDSWRPLPTSV